MQYFLERMDDNGNLIEIEVDISYDYYRGREATRYDPPEAPNAEITAVCMADGSPLPEKWDLTDEEVERIIEEILISEAE